MLRPTPIRYHVPPDIEIPQAPPPPSSLEVRLRQILSESDFPAISKDALDALRTTPENDASLQKLANIVMREYALTLKVLRTANSAYYKRSGRTIQSATHAMLLLGATTVRHLAASLLLFDHYRKRSPGLKELMCLSMLTANHARELAARRDMPDPEEAHLAGMFRNLGEVLVAGYLPREYARILQHMESHGKGVTVASFEVLGFILEDLGMAMAKHWGMPDAVAGSMRADGPLAGRDLSAIIACAHDLTHAVYRRGAGSKGRETAVVVERYARRLRLTSEEVSEVLGIALHETRETMSSAKVSLDDLRLRKQLDEAVRELGVLTAIGRPATPLGNIVVEDVEPLSNLRVELLQAVRNDAKPDSGAPLSRVIMTVLEAIYRGGPFDRAVFCIMSRDGNSISARFGLGTAVESLLERFRFELNPRGGLIPVAMLRRESMYAPVDHDFTSQELRFAQSLGASSFGVFPLVVGGRLIGCVYCDRLWNARMPDKEAINFTREVFTSATQGIEARTTGPTGTQIVAPRPGSATPTYALDARRAQISGR